MELEFTPRDHIPKIVEDARKCFNTLKTKNVNFRKKQLKNIVKMMDKEKDNIVAAIFNDLHKPEPETLISEVVLVYNEAIEALKKIDSWVKPQHPSVDMLNVLDGCQVRSEPLGVILIIGAWNFPLLLTLSPMVGAIAAGNTVVLKPSEISSHTARLLAEIIPKYLDPEAYQVVNGGAGECTALLEQRFDHIVYTGNSSVGRIVMTAAAKFLTPVTLELGGKSPVIIDEDIDFENTARRLVWGKAFNAGQVCTGPDYVLIKKGMEEKLIQHMKEAIKEFFPDGFLNTSSFSRIVNKNHFKRIKGLMDSAGGEVVIGGEVNEEEKFISLTVILNPKEDAPIMKEEIFGPILPVVSVNSIDEAIQYVNAREKPLALYIFSNDTSVAEKVLYQTSSGGALVNDILSHASSTSLPFGGVGASGMGNYHGKYSFDRFSHKRAIMVKSMGLEVANNLRYPPYTSNKLKWVLTFLKK
jgi:aldehyde dehydrogenase (NAD+)